MNKNNSVEPKILYGRDVVTNQKARFCDAVLDENGSPVKLRVKNGKRVLEIMMDDLLRQCKTTA